jgi:hypothetical protein
MVMHMSWAVGFLSRLGSRVPRGQGELGGRTSPAKVASH